MKKRTYLDLLAVASPQISAALFFTSCGFVLIGIVGYLMAPPRLSFEEIESFAQRDTPQIECPPRPAGEVEQYTVSRQICTDIPKIVGGFPPQIKMQKTCNTIQEPATRFIDVTTDEIRQWETGCQQLTNERRTRLQARIDEISARQRSELKEFVNDMIKIAVGIVGVMAAFLGLWAGGKISRQT